VKAAAGGARRAPPRLLGPQGGILDLGLDVRLELLLPALGQEALLDQVLAHAHERVLLAPQLDLGRRSVAAVVVVGGVPEVAIGLALDQGGALALPGMADGRMRRRVDVDGVVAVHDHSGQPVGMSVLGDVLDRRLFGERDRDGVAVVLADEHDRQPVDAGEVEGLVKVALRGGAVAEVGHDDVVSAFELGRQRHAGGVRKMGGDR
jgi:hypothetical protein